MQVIKVYHDEVPSDIEPIFDFTPIVPEEGKRLELIPLLHRTINNVIFPLSSKAVQDIIEGTFRKRIRYEPTAKTIIFHNKVISELSALFERTSFLEDGEVHIGYGRIIGGYLLLNALESFAKKYSLEVEYTGFPEGFFSRNSKPFYNNDSSLDEESNDDLPEANKEIYKKAKEKREANKAAKTPRKKKVVEEEVYSEPTTEQLEALVKKTSKKKV
jgi:hypothetical protein